MDVGNVPNESMVRNVSGGNMIGNGPNGTGAGVVGPAGGGSGGGGGGTTLFVGDLHWWTKEVEIF